MSEFHIAVDVSDKGRALELDFEHRRPRKQITLTRGGVEVAKVVPVNGHAFGENPDGTECILKWNGQSFPALYIDHETFGYVVNRGEAASVAASATPSTPPAESGPVTPPPAPVSRRRSMGRSRRDSR